MEEVWSTVHNTECYSVHSQLKALETGMSIASQLQSCDRALLTDGKFTLTYLMIIKTSSTAGATFHKQLYQHTTVVTEFI